MRALFFDTETTGLPKDKKKSANDGPGNWPEPVSISWIVTDEKTVIRGKSYIVRPNGWQIPADSIRIHGITQKLAEENGTDLSHILGEFVRDLRSVDMVIAHNLEFDKNVFLSAVLYLTKDTLAVHWPKYEFCTMENARNLCKLVTASSFSYKSPRLSELYEYAFKTKPAESMLHTSLGDVQLLVACFFRIWTLKQAAAYVREDSQSPVAL